ncbi:MAG: PAS domain-containing protein [Dongiaceae bacterium]
MPRHFEVLHAYWQSLANGAVPDHALVEPGPILDLLPFLMFVEFEEKPFRVRYRLSGSKLDYISNTDLTGRYLDEFGDGTRALAVDILTEHYLKCRDLGQPVYGTYTWPDITGKFWPVEFVMFPLAVRGQVKRCMAIESYGFDLTEEGSGMGLDPRLPRFL